MPEWLGSQLVAWLRKVFTTEEKADPHSMTMSEMVVVPHRARVRGAYLSLQIPDRNRSDEDRLSQLLGMAEDEEDCCLDLVDFAVSELAPAYRPDASWILTGTPLDEIGKAVQEAQARLKELEDLLSVGCSVWTPAVREGSGCLEERVSEETRAAVNAATSDDSAGARSLSIAWAAAYRRDPDADKAHDEAIRAIEAAGKAVIIPRDDRATLGKMVVAMRDEPRKWATALSWGSSDEADGVDAIRALCETVWSGHVRRHGSEDTPTETDLPRARMAVHAALLLVACFRQGYVYRRDDGP